MIRLDDRAQPRAALSNDRVAEYVEDMSRGDKFPPLVVFQDRQSRYWLADGFHRYHALVGIEAKTVDCIVHDGELREAILYSCGANAAHGLRRTNADKRSAVTKLLNDEEWRQWSDREIARRCNVSDILVAATRKQLAPVHLQEVEDTPRKVSRGGKTYTQNTANIGKSRTSGDEQPPPPRPLPPQIVRDNENGWISSALWEIERQIDKLPPPDEAAARFPTHHRHTLSAEKLHALAQWLDRFAYAWEVVVTESHHGKEDGPQATSH